MFVTHTQSTERRLPSYFVTEEMEIFAESFQFIPHTIIFAEFHGCSRLTADGIIERLE